MKKIIACIGTFFALVALSTQAKNPYLLQTADRSAMEHWVDSVFETLSPKERIAQLLVITVRNSDTPQNRKTLQRLIQEQKIGGLLFDSGTAKDQANLTNYCQSLSKVPLMVTLDGEWGLAMRLSDTPRFPVNMMLGAVQNDSLLYEYGRAVGKQCKRMGIHVNFAPVLDINSNPRNPVIGKRSFGESLKNVSSKAIAYAKGLESVGVMAVAKHFPGHGDTSEDSHKTLPLVPHSKERLMSTEIPPFKAYIDSGLSGIMVGHLNIPAWDATNTEEQLNSILSAIEQGEITQQAIDEKCKKVLRYKYVFGLANYTPIKTKNLIEDLNATEYDALNRKLNSEAMTLLRNSQNLIPITHLNKGRIAVVSVGNDTESVFQ